MWQFWNNVTGWDIVVEKEVEDKDGKTRTDTYYRTARCTDESEAWVWAELFASYTGGKVVSVTRQG